ncbi:hypothetical protein [Streptomyces longwoodensis]|uniref:hypothetical protein n=1 Tax=Streptomyces longwoodensis TaxID=68231 RepID=UPI002258FDE8|nr:hypothetical protein [Streptomyces longwoodensis]MCX4994308.1 hypothetical protein [Streptomyces longwoodensis]
MSQGERPESTRFEKLAPFSAGASGALATTFGVVAAFEGGPPLTQQLPFWLAVGFGVLTVSVVIFAVAQSLTRARREEQREVAASQERLVRAEGHFVDALNIQAGSSLFTDAFLQSLQHQLQKRHGDDSGSINIPDARLIEVPEPSPADASLLTLSALWATTHARLKLYHDVALGQANRSFRSAQRAMWLGFIALAGFVIVALQASTTAGSIVAGGLGAVAAGLAGFIGRTFVRSQETAAEHLRSYFDQPLELSRYLAAERLVADAGLSPEQRANILATLVTAMVSTPQPSVDAQAQTGAASTREGTGSAT